MKKNLLLWLIAALLLPACSKKTIDNTHQCSFPTYPVHPKGELFQSVIEKYVQKGLPGVTLLIKDQQGTWVGSAGMADIANNVPMQPCQVAKVASITKLFMAVLSFKLVEEGMLDLDQKINTYLTDKQLKGIANANEVTVRQLLNHRSGIYDVIKDQAFYLDILNNPPKHRNQQDILKFVRGKEAAFPAGSTSGYSNTNYLLLSMIIDGLGLLPHARLLHQQILDPLQLENSYYFYHDALPKNDVVQGYYDLYNNGTIENLSSYNTGSGNGYTGLYSNVFDLLHFTEALFVDHTLVTQTSLHQMMQFSPKTHPEDDRLLGAGLMKDFINRPDSMYAYGHRGRDLAYSADLDYFPTSGQIMVLIVNYGTDGESRLRPVFYELRTAIVDAMAR